MVHIVRRFFELAALETLIRTSGVRAGRLALVPVLAAGAASDGHRAALRVHESPFPAALSLPRARVGRVRSAKVWCALHPTGSP